MSEPRARLATAANEPWVKLLDVSGASAALDLTARPADANLINLRTSPLLVLRAFLTTADNVNATFDVLAWPQRSSKAVRLARLTAQAGSQSIAVDPELGQPGTFYEADQFVFVDGLVRPTVLSRPDQQALCYLDTLDFALASIRCESLGSASRLIVMGKPAEILPPTLDLPFIGTIVKAAATASNESFKQLDDTTALASPGSGWRYAIRELIVSAGANVDVTVGNAAGSTKYLPTHTFPAGVTRIGFDSPLLVAENELPYLTATSFTGRVTVRGSILPV